MQNTEKRICELSDFIDKTLQAGTLTCAAALALRGRMQFANSQVWGRASKVCLKQVTVPAYDNEADVILEPLASALSTFKKVLNTGKPREIVCGMNMPLFIFTDASFEQTDLDWPAGIGGVLYDESGRAMEYFSYCLAQKDLERLGFPKYKQTVIFETKVLAVIAALQVGRKKIADRPVVIFVDNNSARDVAISDSPSHTVQNTPISRTTFGSCDVEKVHTVVARSTFPSQNVQNTFSDHFWNVEKVHAVVARSTFRSQNVQNTPFSDHFWKLRCRKSARRCGAKHISKSKCQNTTCSRHFWRFRSRKSTRRCGAKHISKSKCTKHNMFAPLLEVQNSKK